MNLVSGLEEIPGYFWLVASGSLMWGGVVYACLVAYHTRPLQSAQRRVADMTALSELLMYNVDIIGEVCPPVLQLWAPEGQTLLQNGQ